jgi:hypothetical protein
VKCFTASLDDENCRAVSTSLSSSSNLASFHYLPVGSSPPFNRTKHLGQLLLITYHIPVFISHIIYLCTPMQIFFSIHQIQSNQTRPTNFHIHLSHPITFRGTKLCVIPPSQNDSRHWCSCYKFDRIRSVYVHFLLKKLDLNIYLMILILYRKY